jgi:hypothetical protein
MSSNQKIKDNRHHNPIYIYSRKHRRRARLLNAAVINDDDNDDNQDSDAKDDDVSDDDGERLSILSRQGVQIHTVTPESAEPYCNARVGRAREGRAIL